MIKPSALASKRLRNRASVAAVLIPALLAVVVIGGCAATGTQGGAAAPGLLDRATVFGNPSRTQARISPDGRYLSWLAPDEGVLNVFVAPASNPAAARAVTRDRSRGIRAHYWSPSSEHLLYLQDQGGNENHHLYAARADGAGQVRDLTPVADGVRATLEGLSDRVPGKVLVGLNDREPALSDLYLVDIASGERELVLENPGYGSIIVDNDLVPRLATQELPEGGARWERFTGDRWAPFLRIPAEDVLNTYVAGFDATNEQVFLIDSRDRDTAALTAMTLATGDTEVLAADPRADIQTLIQHPRSKVPLAFASEYERRRWQALDDGMATTLAAIAEQVDGDISIVSMTETAETLLLAVDSSVAPLAYYRYDVTPATLEKLFDVRPALVGKPLARMQSRVIDARDGVPLVSYLTLPVGSDPDGDGVPAEPLPMVLYVHGGPWARDSYGYNSVHQWLANRGYAVLSVNYRGSTGFGKNFTNAAVREFAGAMHNDLLDVVSWAVDGAIALPDRVAIMGGSYGGYATLVGVSFTPDRFACGVDIVGPSSLVTLVESFPAYWAPFLANSWFKFVGDPTVSADRSDMLARSPITRVADIRAPLLIGQGQNDPRVTKLESDQLVAAMAKRGASVTYLNYPDEGHGFARPENRLSFFATTEAFLSQCLGGTYQPIGADFQGSSVEVLHGADVVPGLAEALQEDAALGES
jgi:dipeptidyl aminopeptidase/acylaminoacyl peptidase